MMLRWMLPFVAAVFAIGSAVAADMSDPHDRPGAPVYRNSQPPAGRPKHVEEDSDLLFTPSGDNLPHIALAPRTPWLWGRSTLPGIYGSNHSYEYQGPYYGGPYTDFRNRAPYTCGVLGYC